MHGWLEGKMNDSPDGLDRSIHSCIHSGYFYSVSSSPLLLRGVPNYSTDTVSELHAEALQTTVSKGFAQGPYMAAGVGFEPATLRMQGTELTTEPPGPTSMP